MRQHHVLQTTFIQIGHNIQGVPDLTKILKLLLSNRSYTLEERGGNWRITAVKAYDVHNETVTQHYWEQQMILSIPKIK